MTEREFKHLAWADAGNAARVSQEIEQDRIRAVHDRFPRLVPYIPQRKPWWKRIELANVAFALSVVFVAAMCALIVVGP